MNLFQRAEEGIARSDWKFVIDSLQRIIEHPEGSLLPRPEGATTAGELFESARRAASRRVGTLPPEGLAAYRLLYDGKARALLERARRDYDRALLRSIVDKYLLTSSGDQAAVLYASWALDEGRPAEALAVLDDLVELVADYDVPQRSIAVKMVAAYTQLGRENEASNVASLFRPASSDAEAAATDLREACAGVIERLRATDEAAFAPTDRAADASSWPVVGGSPSRRSLMADVSPTIGRAVPWRATPPGGGPGSWRPTLSDSPADPLVAPPGHLVAGEGRVLARTPAGLAAYDIRTLEPLWVADHPASVPTSASRELERVLRGSPMWTEVWPDEKAAVLEDRAAWSVSIAHGLALSLSRVEGVSDVRTFMAGGMRLRLGDGSDGSTGTMILSAHDLQTGELRWQRGMANDEAPLAGARFRAMPIAVGGDLWVPIQQQRDLYVVMLDPRDGSLVRSVLLGTLPGRSAPVWQELRPAADEGTVYIPTGLGTVFAVDAQDHSLRWAARYATSTVEQAASGWTAARVRLPSSPAVIDGLLLFIPSDRQRLFALSTADGELRWSMRTSDTAYILAAGDGSIWLGGRKLARHLLRDGSELWRTEVGVVPTGRAVLSGDTILVPTWDGLASYDAKTGAQAGFEPLPTAQPPLGNLLCVDNAMFSFDPGSIRRFPDVARAYPVAVARHAYDPADVSAAADLAWLEIMRGAPDRALDVVDEPRIRSDAAHGAGVALTGARVEALLEMAARSGSAEPALRLLESAVAAAHDPADRLRSGLALAERLGEAGRTAEAYRAAAELGLSPAAEIMIPVADYVQAPARRAVSELLARLAASLNGAERTSLDGELSERLGRAAALVDDCEPLLPPATCEAAEAELEAAARLGALGAPADRARLALADLRTRQWRYEEAEQYLLQCAAHGLNADDRIAALLKLYDLYGEAWSAAGPMQWAILDELTNQYADAAMPGMPGQTVRGWVESARATVPVTTDSRPDASFALTGSPAWAPIVLDVDRRSVIGGSAQNQRIPPALFDFGQGCAKAMADRLVALGADLSVECYDAANGEILWRSPLAGEEAFVERLAGWRRPEEQVQQRAWRDGQTGVVASDEGLFAVGLTSGKRVWSRLRQRDDFETRMDPDAATTAGGRGWLATMLLPGRLTVVRTLDGSTIWQRDLHGESVHDIRVFDSDPRHDRVTREAAGLLRREMTDRAGSDASGAVIVTLDTKHERAQVLSAVDGRLIAKTLFQQPNIEVERIDIVSTAGVLVGPRSDRGVDAVVGVAMADGKAVWQLPLPQPLVTLFIPAEGYAGIGLLGGGVRIVDADIGEVVFEKDALAAQRVVDGLLINGTVVLRYVEPSGTDVAMAAYDLATGDALWQRDGLAPLDAAVEPLRLAGGLIPTLLVQDQRVRGRNEFLSIVMVDPRTGEDVGRRVDFVYGYGGEGTGVRIAVRSGAIVVGTMMGVFPFETEPVVASRAGDS